MRRRGPLSGAFLFPLPLAAVGGGSLFSPSPAGAQVTAPDYARAERFLPWNARNLVSGDQVTPTWLKGDRFWYRNHMKDGYEFVLVDPIRGTRAPLFDHARLAAALSLAASLDQDWLDSSKPAGSGPIRAIGVQVDVASCESVQELVRRTLAELGRLDILVNRAAIDPKFDPQHVSSGPVAQKFCRRPGAGFGA